MATKVASLSIGLSTSSREKKDDPKEEIVDAPFRPSPGCLSFSLAPQYPR